MPICAIYARVSDESQVQGDSIEHQISFCREIARRRSSETGNSLIVDDAFIYVDAGISGTSLLKRSEVQRMIRDAKRGRFDTVLFKGVSRFARDTVDALLMLRTLLACGVRVISMEENFDSQRDNAEFVFTIHSALAQAESEKTAIRVRLGAMEKARQGKWNGPAPDGYVLNKATKRLEVDPPYANVIREIYALYLDGYGVRKIAAMLNERGQRTKRGSLFSQRTISRVLTNPAYIGVVTYGKRQQKRASLSADNPMMHRKITVWTEDPEQIVTVADAHPPIIPRDVFVQVAKKMAERRTHKGRDGELQILSRGILRCRCGSSMAAHYNARGMRYYRCVRQADLGRAYCTQPFLRGEDVEQILLQHIASDIAKFIRFNQRVEPTPAFRNQDAQLRDVRTQMQQSLRTSQIQMNCLASGDLSEEQFAWLNHNVRERIKQLKAREQELINALAREPSRQEMACALRVTLEQLLSSKTTDIHATRQLLTRLVASIVVDRYDLQIDYRFSPP